MNRWLLCFCLVLASLSVGPVAGARCHPITSARLAELVREGRQRLVRLDGEAALALLNQVQERIECLSEPPDQRLLAQSWLWLGVARQLGGDPDGSAAAFEQAIAIDPELPWDETFADVGRPNFDQARTRMLVREPAELELPALDVDGQFYLDGRSILTGTRHLSMAAGRHLLQVLHTGNVIWHQLVELHSGTNVIDEPERPSDSHAPAGWIALSLGYGASVHSGGRIEGRIETGVPITGGWLLAGGLAFQGGGPATHSGAAAWGLELAVQHQWSVGRFSPSVGLGALMWRSAGTGLFSVTAAAGLRWTVSPSWQLVLSPGLALGEPGMPGMFGWRWLAGVAHGFL